MDVEMVYVVTTSNSDNDGANGCSLDITDLGCTEHDSIQDGSEKGTTRSPSVSSENTQCGWYFAFMEGIYFSAPFTVFIGLLGCMFVSMVVMGVVYWKECFWVIPAFQVVGGVCGFISTTIAVVKRCRNRYDEEDESAYWTCNALSHSNTGFIMFSSFVVAAVMTTFITLKMYDIEFVLREDNDYCDEKFYNFAYWTCRTIACFILLYVVVDVFTAIVSYAVYLIKVI